MQKLTEVPSHISENKSATILEKDSTFIGETGLNDTVSSLAIQSDGKILVGGNFTSYNGSTANRLIRLNTDGTRDTSFDTGTGLNDTVQTIALQSDGKILVGGRFTAYNGSPAKYLIRLNKDGTRDLSFNTGTGFDNSKHIIFINSLALQSDGKILVGGNFTGYNNKSAHSLIRLNTDGTPDPAFHTGAGFDFWVQTIAFQNDGKILVGGDFTTYNNSPAKYFIRLHSDGTQDTSFDTGSGFDDNKYTVLINTIAIQNDEKILVGGNFTIYNGSSANYLIRLNTNGTKDTSFNTGTGFNDTISCIALQSDGKILVGGAFTSYNNNTANRLICLHRDGTRDTSFDTGTGFGNIVSALAIQNDGKILAGGHFTDYDNTPAKYIIRLTPQNK